MSIDTPTGAPTDAVARLAKVLADPVRVRIVEALRDRPGEVCQCHLQPLLGVSQPTLSHHLKKLVDAGLVTVDRRGSWAYYTLRPEGLAPLRDWL